MQCEFIKLDGEKCLANAMDESRFCFSHNPAVAEEKMEAVKKGGLSPKKNTLNLPPIEIKSVQDVVLLLENSINMIRSGQMSTNVGNCVGYLSTCLIKAFEINSIEKRLEEIEGRVFRK